MNISIRINGISFDEADGATCARLVVAYAAGWYESRGDAPAANAADLLAEALHAMRAAEESAAPKGD